MTVHTSMSTEINKKRCFVVMGFGTKTDLATGRQLDLNKSYRLLIKPVVESKDLICIRADEIPHSGSIDVRMYQELLNSDIVIADLSTANVNAFYELGIRHALRPRTTIVISEDKLSYPFDLNHIKITSYTHLGNAIDYEEVMRFRTKLGETIDAVLSDEHPDSPVYTYLSQLVPPFLENQTAKAIEQIDDALEKGKEEEKQGIRADSEQYPQENKTLALLTQQGEQALKNNQFAHARSFFKTAILLCQKDAENNMIANDAYLIHRLALATYKAEEPAPIPALKEALKILYKLDLDHTNDSETVVLAGVIEKQLYEMGQGDQHLANAILYYERGYYLLNNRYNGINLAFLLNCRADSSLVKTKEEQIADMINANRTRQRVLMICHREWQAIHSPRDSNAKIVIMLEDKELSLTQKEEENEQKFWILVNKAEAHFGLGELEEYKKAIAEAKTIEHSPWMMNSFEQQVIRLKALMEKLGHLLDPPWPKGVLP
jgi:hypothetical protein